MAMIALTRTYAMRVIRLTKGARTLEVISYTSVSASTHRIDDRTCSPWHRTDCNVRHTPSHTQLPPSYQHAPASMQTSTHRSYQKVHIGPTDVGCIDRKWAWHSRWDKHICTGSNNIGSGINGRLKTLVLVGKLRRMPCHHIQIIPRWTPTNPAALALLEFTHVTLECAIKSSLKALIGWIDHTTSSMNQDSRKYH